MFGQDCPDENVEDCAGECGGSAYEVTLCEDTDGDGLGNPGSETIECIDGGADSVCATHPQWMPVDCTTNFVWSDDREYVTIEEAEENHALWTGCVHFGPLDNSCSFDGTGYVSTQFFTMYGCNTNWVWMMEDGNTLDCANHDGDFIRRLVMDPNGCYDYSGSAFADADDPVEYNSSLDISGFQFDVDGASTSGGDRDPELVEDCSDEYPDCFENYVDECGECNGDGPAEHYDCDGNCLVELDCAGNCCVLGEEGCYWQETGPCGEEGPSDGMDSCGVCGGDNTSCMDCSGVPCSDAYMDNCGICDDDPTNDCGYECGSWGGDAFLDECGVCYGDGIADGECDCEGNVFDCAGYCGGELEWDCAGICGGDNSSYDGCCGLPPNDDCTDDCYIDSLGACCIEENTDECGLCFGDGTSCLLLGDINGDGTINVIDIVMVVDLILSNNYDVVGDVNEDGQLNVIDIVMLVDWVLNGTGCSDEAALDYDMDGICDAEDADDDNDGAPDPDDSDDNNEYVCSDVDEDNCDDCSSGTFNPYNDGIDMNANGICDEGEANNDTDGDGVIDDEDSDPFNPYECSDLDGDTCDDCSIGMFNPTDDGYDYDSDGACDAGDSDDDNDGCLDSEDESPHEWDDDYDGDGIPDDCDCDDDNDGCQECWDYCP